MTMSSAGLGIVENIKCERDYILVLFQYFHKIKHDLYLEIDVWYHGNTGYF